MFFQASLARTVAVVALGAGLTDAAKPVAVQPVSLKSALDAKMNKALDLCWALLLELGPSCPRFAKLSTVGEARSAMEAVQRDVFRAKFTTPDGVMGMLRGARTILSFHSSAQTSVWESSEWIVAALLRDQLHSGKSKPGIIYRACVWCEACFEMNLFTSSPLVLSQKSPTLNLSSSARNLPVPAELATFDMIIAMESMVRDAPSSVMRCWAGVFCALAHGVLRWSDLQRSEGLTLTNDAVTGISWRMKKKWTKVRWAALRRGFSDVDWAEPWLDELHSCGLPAPDFVIKDSDKAMSSFLDRPASFYDAQAAMRVLLVACSSLNFSVAEALRFSCHSWRHFYPTAGKQLRMNNEQINKMGHWDPNSRMPDTYDAKACVAELLYKSEVRNACSDGWRLVEDASLPSPPPGTPASAPSACKRRKVDVSPPAASPIIGTAVARPVLRVDNRRLHLWTSGPYTVCDYWKCGTPEAPAAVATFFDFPLAAEARSAGVCKACSSSTLVSSVTRLQFSQPLFFLSTSSSSSSSEVSLASSLPSAVAVQSWASFAEDGELSEDDASSA